MFLVYKDGGIGIGSLVQEFHKRLWCFPLEPFSSWHRRAKLCFYEMGGILELVMVSLKEVIGSLLLRINTNGALQIQSTIFCSKMLILRGYLAGMEL